jgi:hypothetical protein
MARRKARMTYPTDELISTGGSVDQILLDQKLLFAVDGTFTPIIYGVLTYLGVRVDFTIMEALYRQTRESSPKPNR